MVRLQDRGDNVIVLTAAEHRGQQGGTQDAEQEEVKVLHGDAQDEQ